GEPVGVEPDQGPIERPRGGVLELDGGLALQARAVGGERGLDGVARAGRGRGGARPGREREGGRQGGGGRQGRAPTPGPGGGRRAGAPGGPRAGGGGPRGGPPGSSEGPPTRGTRDVSPPRGGAASSFVRSRFEGF